MSTITWATKGVIINFEVRETNTLTR